MTKAILQPYSQQRLGDMLKIALKQPPETSWQSFQAAVAFVKRSGVQHIETELRGFVEHGGYVRFIVGIDQHGTSLEGLSSLLAILSNKGELWINHDSDNYVTFHPKLYLFEKETSALLIVGSGNLTQGGLYTNDEASLVNELDLSNQDDLLFLEEIKDTLDSWCDNNLASVRQLDKILLNKLVEADYIRPEEKSRTEDEAERKIQDSNKNEEDKLSSKKSIFGRGIKRKAPSKQKKVEVDKKRQSEKRSGKVEEKDLSDNSEPSTNQFIVTILHGDLPQRGSSNEIRLAKGIRDINPVFWGWPDMFDGPDDKGQYTRNIHIRFQNQIIEGYLKNFPSRKPDGTKASGDFRIGAIAPVVKSLQEEDDILILEISNEDDIDFVAQVIVKSNEAEYRKYSGNLIEYKKARSSVTGTYRKYKYESDPN